MPLKLKYVTMEMPADVAAPDTAAEDAFQLSLDVALRLDKAAVPVVVTPHCLDEVLVHLRGEPGVAWRVWRTQEGALDVVWGGSVEGDETRLPEHVIRHALDAVICWGDVAEVLEPLLGTRPTPAALARYLRPIGPLGAYRLARLGLELHVIGDVLTLGVLIEAEGLAGRSSILAPLSRRAGQTAKQLEQHIRSAHYWHVAGRPS